MTCRRCNVNDWLKHDAHILCCCTWQPCPAPQDQVVGVLQHPSVNAGSLVSPNSMYLADWSGTVVIASVPVISILSNPQDALLAPLVTCDCRCMQNFGLAKTIHWPAARAQQPAAAAGTVIMFWLGTVCMCSAGASNPLHPLLSGGA